MTSLALFLATPAHADRHPPRYGNHDVMQSPSDLDRQEARPPGWFGIRVAGMTPELRAFFEAPSDRGVLVTRVHKGGAAERAGVKVGDVIVGISKRQVKSPRDLQAAIAAQRPGQRLELDVVRGRVNWNLARRDAPAARHHRAAPVEPEPQVVAPAREGRLQRKMNALDGRLERLEKLLQERLAPPIVEPEVRPRHTPPPRLEEVRPIPQPEEPEMVPAPELDDDFELEPLPRRRI